MKLRSGKGIQVSAFKHKNQKEKKKRTFFSPGKKVGKSKKVIFDGEVVKRRMINKLSPKVDINNETLISK